ncbi:MULTISPECIES: N-acetylmuramoyl-L-alanine amidase [Brevibacterium]|uniref:N-acetylmuramoyl-L-alanine amidase n=2 Tax=Brevibacterium TaxID=1696 RepID=A0A1H1X2L8_BRESA|nr:N-acetylmuramoyl-L-alanine amidase [Brevibacterium sandarakinum]SDT02799.1 N-acetylmuramoyl-L-alanine amidase [Brevibacterium sandarakinum]
MSPRHSVLVPVLCATLALPGLTGCGANSPSTPDTSTPMAPEAMSSPTSPDPRNTATTKPGIDLSGRTVAIDPGHNGGNASHPKEINRQVPDGRGGTKACNTTGTSTNSDYPETDFNWAVAQKLEQELDDAGAEVVMSRDDNTGVGPCVDERGTFADDADLMVSIHANGSESAQAKGFHVIVAEPGSSDAVEDDSNRLADEMSNSMADSFTPNTAYGKNAISRRPDLAGLNNASVPAVIVECGEMRNPGEAKTMESESGQQKYADALMQGIVDWY